MTFEQMLAQVMLENLLDCLLLDEGLSSDDPIVLEVVLAFRSLPEHRLPIDEE